MHNYLDDKPDEDASRPLENNISVFKALRLVIQH